MKFTDRSIQALKPSDHRYVVWETNGKGFGIRVAPSGRKSWIYQYRFDGKNRKMTLGTYPAISLKKAHVEHAKAFQLLEKNMDPGTLEQAEKAERRASPTIGELVTEYLEKWAKPRKRSWKEDERQLQKDVTPKWGERKARDVTRRDVRLMIETVAARGSPIAANRLLAVVRRMFNFAVEQDILEHSPCTGIKAVAKERRKDRVLTEEEIRSLWQKLSKPPADKKAQGKQDDQEPLAMSDEVRRVLKLILVTAQRPGEVAALHSDEIDGEWWTIPSEKAKNDFAHRVPLSALAREILEDCDGGYVFSSPKKGNDHIHVNALSHAIRVNLDKLGTEPFTPHDLRRTAASHMTGMGVPRLVVAKILNHVEPGVTAVYDRHSYDVEKKQALNKWGRKLKKIIEAKREENVVHL